MSKIKFGTSGWRAIIADDFTFDNVRLVCQAISEYVKSKYRTGASIIVGGDTRFLSEKFSETATEVFCGNGIKTFLCNRDTPTPVISFEIIRRKLSGGVNFTASHNPYQYQGLKFSPASGGPATPEVTKIIEKYCSEKLSIKTMDLKEAAKNKLLETINPAPHYLKHIGSLVDLDAIEKSRIKVGIDLKHGTARGYLDDILEEVGVDTVVLNKQRDVLFAGGSPEPSKENLKELYEVMKKEKLEIGLATDGDADRFGVIDCDGSFITPNYLIAILLYHLIKSREYEGVVVRSVMTTHLIDKIARFFAVEVVETPVGFKYIGEVMLDKNSAYPFKKGDFIIGGEESGGLTIRGHVPEKDGILACLLALEAVVINKKPLKEILFEIMEKVGKVYTERINLHMTPSEMERLKTKLAKSIPKEICGIKVEKVITVDGYKFILEDSSWLGIRLSGTEPVVRLYLETDSEVKLKKLATAGESFIRG